MENNIAERTENFDVNPESRVRTRNLDENSENINEEIIEYSEEEEDSENITQEYVEYLEEEEDSGNITQEIIEYFEEEEDSEVEKRKGYFDSTKIKSAAFTFMNCKNLKKIKFPPSFNVGKNAKGMFKGCSKLEEVNTTAISSTELEEMDSMFEDCLSLREIIFSNDFLTGEIKSLNNVFIYNLENCSNIFDGASINGTLKIGKYYSNNNTRDNLFKEIANVTDANTGIFTPKGTTLNVIFENIYYSVKKVKITVNIIDIDYNIHYKEDENYKLYSACWIRMGL